MGPRAAEARLTTRRQLLVHVAVQALLWLAIAVVANHAASAWFVRVDLTEDQAYTLTPVAREVMGRLEKPLVARVYFTSGLEAPYNDHQRAVQEKLEELRAWSGGRMEVHVVDPQTAEQTEEAMRFGVNPIQYAFKSRERSEVKQVFMGVSLVYGDEQQVVDPITTLGTLEYDLVRAIRSLATEDDDRKVVGVLQGNGEPDLAQFPEDNPMAKLRQQLMASYTLRNVALGGDLGVPDDVDALLVIGPQQALTDRAQYQLDQFLMRGGSIAFFLSGIKPDFDTMRALDVRHDLDAWIGSRGVRLDKNTLIDRKHNEVMRMPVLSGRRKVLVPISYPLIPVTTDVLHDSPITRGLNRAVVPFTSSITLSEPPAGVELVPLLKSSAEASAVSGLRTVRPDAFGTVAADEKPGPFLLAAAATGRFRSFYADRPIPPAPAGVDGSVREDDPDEKIVDGDEARLVVVASADFVANNLPFVMNAVDWMVQDPSMNAIRARTTRVDLLEPPEGTALLRWKVGITFAPLLLLWLVGGIVVLSSRRSG